MINSGITLELIIENFQSIEYMKLLLNSLTVITGDNSIGKSAILRAISFLMYGKSGDFFIRDGQKTCKITLITPDHTIVWEKTRKKGQIYYVDDPNFENPIEKMKSLKDVEELLQTPLFSVSTVNIGDRVYTPQLHKQGDVLFGVSETDQQNYKNITALITEDGLDSILKAISSDRRTHSIKSDHLLDDLSDVERVISLYDETKFNDMWDNLYTLYSTFLELKGDFDIIDSSITSLTELNNRCRTYTSTYEGYKKVYNIFTEFKTGYQELASIQEMLTQIGSLNTQVNNLTRLKTDVLNISTVLTSMSKSMEMFSTFQKFDVIDRKYSLLIEVKKQLMNFTISINDLDLKSKWYEYGSVIERDTQFEIVENSYKDILKSFEDVKEFFTTASDYFKSRVGLHYLQHYINNVASIETEIVQQRAKVKELQNEKITLEGELGVCPLCNRSFK